MESVVQGEVRKFFEGLPYPELMKAVHEVEDILMDRAAREPERCRKEYEAARAAEETAIRKAS